MRTLLLAVALGIVGAIAVVAFCNWIAIEGRRTPAEFE